PTIAQMYLDGLSTCEIAEIYDCNGGQIWRALQKENVKCRPIAKYTCDEDYMETISDENRAYILGWFFSDGNVTQNLRTSRIGIQSLDLKILEWIKEQVGYNGPIYGPIYKEGNREPQ